MVPEAEWNIPLGEFLPAQKDCGSLNYFALVMVATMYKDWWLTGISTPGS